MAAPSLRRTGAPTLTRMWQAPTRPTGWLCSASSSTTPPGKRALETLVALRVFLFALPYGDQGLLIRRRHYAVLGGFRPLPLMEDVDFIRRIGRRRLRPLPCAATTSARRWREEGWITRSARNLACLTMFSAGAPIERIARFYER